MKCIEFSIGDLLVTEYGTIAVVHDIIENMNGNKAIFLLHTKREDIVVTTPYAAIDIHLTEDIEKGIFQYYPVIK